MGFLEKLGKTIDIWRDGEEEDYNAKDDSKNKGDLFEQYTVNILNKQKKYFTLFDWTRDIHDKQKGTYVESNRNPDLLVQYDYTKEKFAIECKWRSGLYYNKKFNDKMLGWATPEKIRYYRNYSKTNKIPVFIFIGLGGRPDNPETTFCIPLEEAKYPDLFPNVLEKYERTPPNKPFFWRDGNLK
ncbi:MAG: hypothetical protein RQ758_03040 [Methanomicrobiaceae archaeon]|nr:hypothetical protein [Methanomicrobiaceae archaeon]